MLTGSAVTLTAANSTLQSGDYAAFNNDWGVPSGQLNQAGSSSQVQISDTMNLPNSVQTSWTFPNYNPPNGIWSYNEVYWGGQYTTRLPQFDTTIANLNTLNVTFSLKDTASPNQSDILFELWTTNSAGQVTGEISVQTYGWQSSGGRTYSDQYMTASVNSMSHTLSGAGTWTQTTYRTTSDMLSGTISFSNILKDLVSRGVISASDHVSGVELGAEAGMGSGTFTVDKFSVYEAVAQTHTITYTSANASQVFDITTNNDYVIDGGTAGKTTDLVRIDIPYAQATLTPQSNGHVVLTANGYGHIDIANVAEIRFSDQNVEFSNITSGAATTTPPAPTPPPAPTGLADASIVGGYVNAAHNTASQALTGSAAAGSTITVYDGATTLGTATANSSGQWSYTLGQLGNGAHSLTATATASGVVSAKSAALAFTVDTAAPGAPANLADAAISNGYVNAVHDTTSQAVTGTAEAGATITVFDGATQLGTASANSSGQWTYIVGHLADGAHSLTATATDAAGNVSAKSAALAFTVDTAAPGAPNGLANTAISNGYVNAAHDTASQAVTGAAAAGATVTVFDGATQLGTATANSSGQWTYIVGHLADGAHSLTATATDAAGNVSAASGALQFTVDTAAPGAPTGLADSAVVNGVVDATHNTASQALTGAAEAGATVTIFDGATQLGTATANSSGQWTYALGQLTSGGHSLTATATDAAGNVGAASGALQFTVTTATTAPPSAPTGLADTAISNGYVNAAHDTTSQAVTGTAAAGATVTVFDGATKLGAATANSSGQWSYIVGHLADGAHSLTATATDSAGNVSAASGALQFAVDTVAPSAPTGLADSAVVNGVVDAAHNTATQALTGAAEAGATVTIFDGATQLGTATANSSGQWAYTVGQLTDGSHSLTATAADAAGNVGAASGALQFTVNTQVSTGGSSSLPPASAAPIVPHVSDITTTWGKGVALTGSAAAGSTVKVYDSGSLIGTVTADSSGDWSLNTRINNGAHSFTEQAIDASGNSVSSTGSAIFKFATGVQLSGGSGDDVLIGRAGDRLTGNGGHDTFVFNPGFGHETVTDFNSSADTIAFDHTLFNSASAVLQHATQSGTSVLITLDSNDVVTLQHTTLSSLSQGNFAFV
jgi:hypothetical protein